MQKTAPLGYYIKKKYSKSNKCIWKSNIWVTVSFRIKGQKPNTEKLLELSLASLFQQSNNICRIWFKERLRTHEIRSKTSHIGKSYALASYVIQNYLV